MTPLRNPVAAPALHAAQRARLVRGFARRFGWQLLWRLLAVLGLAAGALWALWPPALPATAALLGGAALAVLASLVRRVWQTNLDLARLADLLRHGDLTQTFDPRAADSGFVDLALALDGLVGDLRERARAERATHGHWQSLVEQVPTPLLAIDDGTGEVELMNHAARRLFDRPHGQRLADFAVYGEGVLAGLRRTEASYHIDLAPPDDAAQRLRVTQSRVVHLGRARRLLALQPVQDDIAAAQLALSGDLVRVLSHEVMNSLTPVTSLAASAATAAAGLPASDEAARLQSATAAVARRSGGLLRFVQDFRQLAHTPQLRVQALPAAPLARHLALLFESQWPRAAVALHLHVNPPDLTIRADPMLLEQVLLNLLRNAAQACTATPAASVVELRIATARSGRALIEVHDNGPGVPEALREDIFLPFFSTRPQGSGIGLSLARQVALTHGGSIQAWASPLGGACFRLVI